MASTASAVIIGDEILSGKFADENGPFLVAELRALGVDLRRITVLPDVVGEIADAVAAEAAKHTYVFTSGGVGPTHDDVTMAGIARAFGVDVVRDPTLEQLVRQHWGERLAAANLRLAEVPSGTTLLTNGDPGWPVMRFRNVFILPGVPSLFRRKFAALAPTLVGAPMCTERLIVRCDEGTLADDLTAVAAAFPHLQFGSYPRFDEASFHVIITIEGRDRAAVAASHAELCQRLGPHLQK
ncbi:MAG: competence/damage-inducible protein A [Myxococcales bacterium]|nr:competence/damage-inducible protein A [Myxococcales bacterium]